MANCRILIFVLVLTTSLVWPSSPEDSSFISSDLEVSHLRLIPEYEALALVEAQEAARYKSKAELRQTIESAEVTEEFIVRSGSRNVVLRRVEKPVNLGTETAPETTPVAPAFSKAPDFEHRDPISQRFGMITLHATNYDDLYSEIVWQDQGIRYTIWTNICTQYLRAIGSFDFNEVNYSYFGFVDQVDSLVEADRPFEETDFGLLQQPSRWKNPPVELSDSEPEYVVIAEDSDQVPEKLFEQMDAILSFYIENEDTLRIEHMNAETMQRARETYRENNPEEPEDSLIILWPEKNSRYQDRNE